MTRLNKRGIMDMTSGPFLKKILIFAIPLMVTGVLQLVYNAADIMVVGRFAGSDSLAAVGSTSSLINLIINLFIGLSTGAGVVTARNIGAEEAERTHRSVHTAMTISIISGFAVGLFGFFFASKFLRLMGTPDNVLPLASLYLKIYFLGAPGSLVFNFGASIVRATGDTKRPLIILSLTGIVNVVLNLILVVVFHLNVAGVAIATIVAQYLSAIFIVLRLIHVDNICKLKIRKLRIYKKELESIIKIGIPAGLQSSLFSFLLSDNTSGSSTICRSRLMFSCKSRSASSQSRAMFFSCII